MSNHFHVLVRVPEAVNISDAELLRRYQILYPSPLSIRQPIALMAQELAAAGEA